MSRNALCSIIIFVQLILQASACTDNFRRRRNPDSVVTPPDSQSPNSSETGNGSTSGELKSGGTRAIAECKDQGSGSEGCAWTFSLDPKTCANKGCSKLVIYFSGGQMSCPDPDDESKYLRYYAKRGYVAACAMAFESSEGSGAIPSYRAASRINTLVKAITSDPNIAAAWSGEHLLFTGVSNGATTPVVAMAREEFDKESWWTGSKNTAACFYDGVANVADLFAFLRESNCAKRNSVLSYHRAYSRYCDWTGGTLPSSWPKPSSCDNPSTKTDTITDIEPDAFAIKSWKLIECGSATTACLKDVIPAAPIEKLCSKIDGGSDHTCEFESFPDVGHIACAGSNQETISSCAEWFEGRLQ